MSQYPQYPPQQPPPPQGGSGGQSWGQPGYYQAPPQQPIMGYPAYGVIAAPGRAPQFNYKIEMSIRYGRFVRWMAIFDVMIVVLYVLSGIFFLLLLLPLPFLGYFAGRRFNRPCALAYGVFLVIMVALRILLIVFFYEVLLMVFMVIGILLEIIVLYFVVQFYRVVGTLDEQEKADAIYWENEAPTAPFC